MANLQIRVNVGRSTSFHYINSNLLIWGPMVSPRFVPNNQTTTKQLFVTCVWTRQLLTIGCHYFPPGLQPLVAEVSTTRISWRLQRHSWSGGLAETRRRRVSCCRRAVCRLCTCENGRCASQARLWGRQCRRWNPRVQHGLLRYTAADWKIGCGVTGVDEWLSPVTQVGLEPVLCSAADTEAVRQHAQQDLVVHRIERCTEIQQYQLSREKRQSSTARTRSLWTLSTAVSEWNGRYADWCLRCGGMFKHEFVVNLWLSLSAKEFRKSVNI